MLTKFREAIGNHWINHTAPRPADKLFSPKFETRNPEW